jgi:hypothetical protein
MDQTLQMRLCEKDADMRFLGFKDGNRMASRRNNEESSVYSNSIECLNVYFSV